MLVPSNAASPAVQALSLGTAHTLKFPRFAPSLALTFVTLFPSSSVTHIFAPSNAKPSGATPAGNVPRIVPSLARILLTFAPPPPPSFATQILSPSNATPYGPPPTVNRFPPLFTGYQRSKAIAVVFGPGEP